MFKEATKLKLRFLTTRGSLSVEQLWDLTPTELDGLAVTLEKAYNDSKGKSFLVKKTTKDRVIKLQFDIVLDILQTKVEEEAARAEMANDKAHNQKILTLIEEKKEETLKNMSVAELEKMLRK